MQEASNDNIVPNDDISADIVRPTFKRTTCISNGGTTYENRTDGRLVFDGIENTMSKTDVDCAFASTSEHTEEYSEVPAANLDEASRDESESETSCAICLGSGMDDRSLLDTCFHAFCFTCIAEWSKQSMTCPLCKTRFKSVIHNISSNIEYDTTDLSSTSTATAAASQRGVRPGYRGAGRFDAVPAYRHPNTSVLSGGGSNAAHHGASGDAVWATAEQYLGVRPGSRSAATVALRRAVYMRNGSLRPMDSGRHKPRDVTARAFRSPREGSSGRGTIDNEDAPALRRLRPWLHREMLILAGHNPDHVWFLETTIEGLLKQGALVDRARMYRELEPFLFRNTGRFISELLAFASSPWDMLTWDQAVRYDFPAATAPPRRTACAPPPAAPALQAVARVPPQPQEPTPDPVPPCRPHAPQNDTGHPLPSPPRDSGTSPSVAAQAGEVDARAHRRPPREDSARRARHQSVQTKRHHDTTHADSNPRANGHSSNIASTKHGQRHPYQSKRRVRPGEAEARHGREHPDGNCAPLQRDASHERDVRKEVRAKGAGRSGCAGVCDGQNALPQSQCTRLRLLEHERQRLEGLLNDANNAVLAMRLRSVNAVRCPCASAMLHAQSLCCVCAGERACRNL